MNQELIERIFDHVENGAIDKAVFTCIRLSRKLDDKYNTIIFLRELYPDKKQFERAFYEETIKLTEKGQSFLYENTFEYWVEERTLSFSFTDDPNQTVLAMGVGAIQRETLNIKDKISDFVVPKGMGQFDTAAFTDRHSETVSRLRLRASALTTILERIRTRCFNYASSIEKQLDSQRKTNSFLSDTQNSVNNYFASRSKDVFNKLQKAASLIDSRSEEDRALLLTSIRRCIKSTANYFYPPSKKEINCSDGVKRKMGDEQYLNRLYEFCSTTFASSTSKDLIKSEVEYLMAFARKLNDVASKGVHSEATSSEAKQGFVGLYLFLSNVINKLEQKDS